ncbi:14613_t:CDS:2, partial [Funneliformis geosporum]
MSLKLKNYVIWYQYKTRSANTVRELPGKELIDLCKAIITNSKLSEPADTLILKVKLEGETEYNTTLNCDYFEEHCNGDFKRLVEMHKIKRLNPISVTTMENERLRDELATQVNPINVTSQDNQEMQRLRDELAALKITQAQALSKEIHVRYNDQAITFRRSMLEEIGTSNVEDLIELIRPKLRKFIEKVSDIVITLRPGNNEVLGSETPITELYNTEDQALRVVV